MRKTAKKEVAKIQEQPKARVDEATSPPPLAPVVPPERETETMEEARMRRSIIEEMAFSFARQLRREIDTVATFEVRISIGMPWKWELRKTHTVRIGNTNFY